MFLTSLTGSIFLPCLCSS